MNHFIYQGGLHLYLSKVVAIDYDDVAEKGFIKVLFWKKQKFWI